MILYAVVLMSLDFRPKGLMGTTEITDILRFRFGRKEENTVKGGVRCRY